MLQHKVNQAYISKNHIIQIQHHITTLRERQQQAEAKCIVYNDKVKTFAPDWSTRGLDSVRAVDGIIGEAELQRLLLYVNTHYQEIHQCGKLDRLTKEIREFELEKQHCICDLEDLHSEITELLEKTTPVAQALGIAGSLEDYHKCIANTTEILAIASTEPDPSPPQ